MNPTAYSRSHTPAPLAAAPSIFDRVLVGVDGTHQGFDACRQVARLAEPETVIEAATVSLFPPAAAAALGVNDLADSLERNAGAALLAAQRILGPHAELGRLEGLTEALLKEVKRTQATLLAIGAPEHSRIEEIVLGGVGGELLHHAPCSMLLARPVPDDANFPRSIVVGIDGSDHAERAYQLAATLATRFHSTLHGVVALGGRHVDADVVQQRHPEVQAATAAPVAALVEAAACADLLIVGSRGLHGLRALGSVSERVAHAASCSVLVVRTAPRSQEQPC
jgi:nucleotide-binding universal stress UspA family protein